MMRSRWFIRAAVASLVVLGLTLSLSCASRQPAAFVFAHQADVVTLDSTDGNDSESSLVTPAIYEGLVRFAPGTLTVEPCLAESWVVSDDKLTWTFKLRQGIKFHDDTPFNAEAVEFTYSRILDEKHPYYQYGTWLLTKPLFARVASVKAIDDSTVEFKLKEPFSPLLTALAAPEAGIVSPTAVQKFKVDYFKNPVGTGPFKFVAWQKDDYVELERNDRYWGKKPQIKRLVIKVLPDNATRILALQEGTIQGLRGIEPSAMDRARSDANLTVWEQPGLSSTYIAWHNQKPPFDNVLVRRALTHAINREAIVRAVWGDTATVATAPMPPSIFGYHPTLVQPTYDPELAKSLLAEAGFKDGFTTTLWTFSGPRAYLPDPRRAAEAIQADLAAVNITVNVETMEAGTVTKRVKNGEHNIMLTGLIPLIPDPWTYMYMQFDKDRAVLGTSNNYAWYLGEEVHAINQAAVVLADLKAREALYRQAQEIVWNDAVRLDLSCSKEIILTRASVADIKFTSLVVDFASVTFKK